MQESEKVKVNSLSRVRLVVTPWTAAYQPPPSMGVSRQEYWSGVPLPSPNWKRSVLIPIPKKGNAKECSNYCTIALISDTSKVMLKILAQNSTQTVNFQIFKLDLEKTEEPEFKLPISIGSSKKQETSRKTSTSALLTMPKLLTVWITANCGKFLKRWEYQTTSPAS